MPESHNDFVSDRNPSYIVHLGNKGLIPQYVMDSDMVTAEECGHLDKVAFADPARRLFPCHTKAACWRSAAHFAGRNMQDNSIKEQIVKMANAFGIQDDVENVFNSFEGEFMELPVAEPPMRKYAFIVDYAGFQNRNKEAYYPINSYSEVVRSAEALDKDFQTHRMNITMMRKVAGNVMEAAEEYGVSDADIPANVRNFGERRLPDPYAAQVIVGCRKQASAPMEEYDALLQDLCDKTDKAATYEEGVTLAEKAASQMVALDAKNGIAYTPSMPNPYEILFTGPLVSDMRKAAAQQVVIGGVSVPVADFVNIPADAIKASFCAKDAAIIKEAQNMLAGEPSLEKSAGAKDKLMTLSPDADTVLLTIASKAGW